MVRIAPVASLLCAELSAWYYILLVENPDATTAIFGWL